MKWIIIILLGMCFTNMAQAEDVSQVQVQVQVRKLPKLESSGKPPLSVPPVADQATPTREEAVKPLATKVAQDKALNEIEQYFNRITTMESGFVQVAPDGQITEGKFYLSRPGKIRWEYFPPASVVIVGKSGLLTYYDKALDQISHSSINSTPVSFLVREHISFRSKDLEVKSLKENSRSYELTLTQKDKEVEGRVVLTFLKMPMELKRIEVIDAAEQHTLITFTSSMFGQPIKGDLFVIQNPRLFKKR